MSRTSHIETLASNDDLERQYVEALNEWLESGEAELWENVVSGGLDDGGAASGTATFGNAAGETAEGTFAVRCEG